ncbi:hypothetical protein LY76DRAFT_243023 [Colletotrichum caudatum]|nr:hypothetical protein LY76DRAFT_243023 [Colletotrichum caudatum]
MTRTNHGLPVVQCYPRLVGYSTLAPPSLAPPPPTCNATPAYCMLSSTSYGRTSVETPRHPLTCIYRLPALRPPLIGRVLALRTSILFQHKRFQLHRLSTNLSSHQVSHAPHTPTATSLCFSFSPVLVSNDSWSQNVVKLLLAPFSSTSNLFLAAPHPPSAGITLRPAP